MNLKFFTDPKLKVKAVRPLVRISMVCLHSCMSESKDGVARFIKDSDLRRIVGKPQAEEAAQAESILSHAIKLAEVLDNEYLVRLPSLSGIF